MPGYSCARFGGEGACPEDLHMPQSVEGRAVAALGSQILHQRRIGARGYVGLDFAACLALLEAQGIPEKIASLLLPYWEAGLIEAGARMRDQDGTE
ncbi:hypothetical protein [Salipiger sp.]|uniref:DUF7697 family protein n=1 Tax=Salipiger sp. TaxID=2078585 RepID=UPI003A97C31C